MSEIVGDITQLCEGRNFLGNAQEGDKKQGVTSVHDRGETGAVPGAARAVSISPRLVSADREGRNVRFSVGALAWLLTLTEAISFCDALEGKLIEAGKKGWAGSSRVGVSVELETGGSVGVIVSLDEACILVEDAHRAIAAIEECEGDTEPAPPPDELELGRGAGGLLTLDEVCS